MTRCILTFFFSFCLSCLNTLFATTFYSNGTSFTNSYHWNTERDGSGTSLNSAGGFSGAGNIQLVIQNSTTMTTSSSNIQVGTLSSGTASSITIESGGNLTATNKIEIAGTGGSYDGDLTIENGATYTHNSTSTEIFAGSVTIGASSTIEFQKYGSSSSVSLPTLAYGHVIINLTAERHFGISSSSSLTINGNLTIESTHSNGLSIAEEDADNVTLNLTGNLTVNGGEFNFPENSNSDYGIINIGGNLSFGSSTVWDNTGSNTVTVNFTTEEDSSSINVNSTADISGAKNDISYVIPNGKTISLANNLEIGNDFKIESGGTLSLSTYYLNGSGNFIANSGSTLAIGHANGIHYNSSDGCLQLTPGNRSIDANTTFIYNGTNAQVTGSGLDLVGDLTGTLQISNTSNSVSLSDTLAFDDGFEIIVDENADLSIGSTLFIQKSEFATINSAGLTINGTVNLEDDEGFSASSYVYGNQQAFQGFTSCVFGNNGLVNYSRSGSQTITNQFTYNHLTLSGTTNKTAAGNLDIDGDLTITGSATFIPGSNQINIGGSWTLESSAIFTETGSTIIFDGTGTYTISSTGSPENFDNVQFINTGTYTLQSAMRINASNSCTINASCTINTGDNEFDSPSGNLVMSSGTLNFETISAGDKMPDFNSITISGGTIELGGAGNQELNGGESYNNLTFSGNGTKTISTATADIDGTVYITESCSLNVTNSTFGKSATNLTMDSGFFIVEGSGTKPDLAGTYALTGGTIEFAGSSNTSIRSPKSYYNIIVSGSTIGGGSGNYTLADGGSFEIESGGVFSATNQRILSSGSASLTVNGTFNTSDNDGFSGTSGVQSVDNNTISVTLGSSSTIGYNSTSGTQNISERDDYANLALSEASSKSFSGTPEISGNLTVSNGSISNLPNTITYNGSSAQQVPGQNFGSATVIFSGGGDKELQGDATFNGLITFTNGVLILGNNDLTIGTGATVSSANSSSYVQLNGTGSVIRNIANSSNATFPIGHNPYLPITIEVTSGSGGDFAVSVADGVNTQPDENGNAISNNAVLKTWTIETPTNTNTCTVTLQWNNTDQSPDPGATNALNTVKMGYGLDNATTWTNEATGSNASNPSSSIYTHSLSGISLSAGSIYKFGIGSDSNPLPVELTNFSGEYTNNDAIELFWSTMQEIDNDRFIVQRSFDQSEWVDAGSVNGQGNKIGQSYYHFYDNNHRLSIYGFAYYRLKQIDYNGTFEYSKIIYLTQSQKSASKEVARIYQINSTQIYISSVSSSNAASLIIYDLSGQQVFNVDNVVANAPLNVHLKPGIYLCAIKDDYHSSTIKFSWH